MTSTLQSSSSKTDTLDKQIKQHDTVEMIQRVMCGAAIGLAVTLAITNISAKGVDTGSGQFVLSIIVLSIVAILMFMMAWSLITKVRKSQHKESDENQ